MSWSGNTDLTGVSRLGSKVGVADDARNLFLKQFAGEVLTSFEEKNIAMPLHRTRTISNGKSAQFPSVGTATAAYQKAGETIYGDSVNHSEVTVTVDDLLVSSVFVPKIDEAMNHYDVRSIYSSEMGNALANAADKNIFTTIQQASAATSGGDLAGYWTGGAGSITVADSDANTTAGQEVVNAIIAGLEQFDGADVTGEKYCVLNPATYYALMGTNSNAIDRDFGGNGSIAGGNVPTVGGVKIYMSNHLPAGTTAETPSPIAAADGGSGRADYDPAAAVKGLLFTKDAAATVKLLDLGVESEYQIERQGTLMVAKYAMGHNVLRGKAAISLV
jgi:hypothetical protein